MESTSAISAASLPSGQLVKLVTLATLTPIMAINPPLIHNNSLPSEKICQDTLHLQYLESLEFVPFYRDLIMTLLVTSQFMYEN